MIPMGVEPVVEGLDDEFVTTLNALGVTVGEEAAADSAQQQMAATTAMRTMRAIQRDIDVADEARNLEKQAIDLMCESQLAPLRARLTAYRAYVENVSALIEWGKKKSHDTPYGTFGVRDAGAKVDCTDRVALAEWATVHAPQFVRVELTVPLKDAKERFSEQEIADMGELDVLWNEIKGTLSPDGELPPGVTLVEPSRTPYVKVAK